MRVLGVIPARGGSKGLPKKNIMKLGDKPLIAWSIDTALKSTLIDKVIVSTDCIEISDIAKKYGAKVPFIRPSELASDTATSKDVLLHTVEYFQSEKERYDYIVLLQPTTPFRKAEDIDAMINKAIDSDVDMVVSVTETTSNPYYVLFEEDGAGLLKKSKEATFTRRQDCPNVYEYNGSIYVIKTSALLDQDTLMLDKVIKYEMDKFHSVDIDDQFDFDYAKFLLEK